MLNTKYKNTSEKVLKILLNIFGNVNIAGTLLCGQPSILK